MQNNLKNLAKWVARKAGFKIGKEIYRGFYYTDKIRNIIYDGTFESKPAILKLYDDPRLSGEPLAQNAFNAANKSKILLAPQVYKYEIVSPKKGWLIMQKLEGGYFMSSPLLSKERLNFLELYWEYRQNVKRPSRSLTLAENLPADEFHIFRIYRWLQLANDKEEELIMNGKKPVLLVKKFIPYFKNAAQLIRKEFLKRKMVWCHGHFKPHEIYVLSGQDKYYLTDFAHTKMYPEGYELAFIIWADWIMSADWRLSYGQWRKGIFEWLKEIEKINKMLKIKNFQSLMRAGLIERILGTILADICATDRPRREKERRIDLLYKLLDELL